MKKAPTRNLSEPKKVSFAPQRSNNEKAISSGERRMVPSASATRQFGNQLRVTVHGKVKDPLNNYSNVLLEPTANPSGEAQYGDPYSKKSPRKRPTNLL